MLRSPRFSRTSGDTFRLASLTALDPSGATRVVAKHADRSRNGEAKAPSRFPGMTRWYPGPVAPRLSFFS